MSQIARASFTVFNSLIFVCKIILSVVLFISLTSLPIIAKTLPSNSHQFFENKVFDDKPHILFAQEKYTTKVNDTKRLQQALNKASKEFQGGVVILRPAKKSINKRFRLDRIDVPSNIRLEIDPSVTLEMMGNLKKGKQKGRFLFLVGRSKSLKKLMKHYIENVEIRSTDPYRNFTIDSKTNMPIVYNQGGTAETGVNTTRSIPVGFFYAKNFAISNVTIIDNHTESVSVQMYPDTDYQDGAYAKRGKKRSDDVFLDGKRGKPLKQNAEGEFIDKQGKVIPDMFAIQRNPTYGRTPIKGSIKNIKALNSHTGYGVVQAYGADWVEIRNIEAFNGIAVRIEAGNGAPNDNVNRCGPYNSSINNIEISDVKVTNGFTGVWLKAHSKIIKNISVHNILAIDSATALLVEKGTLCRECRDLTRGWMENVKITGDIILKRTIKDKAVAEVGLIATNFLAPSERAKLIDKNKDGKINWLDLPRNKSGKRWYLIQPTAPVLANSQLSATEIGDQSDKEGFFAVDYSKANIQGINLLRPEKILYRNDMYFPDGKHAKKTINK
ncbi:hypothetical protein [Algibacillus agarilyticus]|uniref:hypothetical protein n=1 Tax=Algibacillus agarilyticus TaxID=2234133 RepID=UPI000DD07F42|nr:hypothetical protein [Algibacillus agarilyticus]